MSPSRCQSGFTLIELMVVMAIIAILATSGLSAYTGYIKKARDTTRIADLAAINSIVVGMLWTSGVLPGTTTEDKRNAVHDAILAANNNQPIEDPLSGTTACLNDNAQNSMGSLRTCQYIFTACDAGMWYVLLASFENESNRNLYLENQSGPMLGEGTYPDWNNGESNGINDNWYDIGSCQNLTGIDQFNPNEGFIL